MRDRLKGALAMVSGSGPATGSTWLIYHRVGGQSPDELDVASDAFANQMQVLAQHKVLSLDDAVDRLAVGDDRASFVLTFDDGFGEVYANAWPVLRELQLPFTIYLTTAYVGKRLSWSGSTAREQGAAALTWLQLSEMVESGLCTIGNHTHTHARPEVLTEGELDACSDEIRKNLGLTPHHYAYTWGIAVPRMEDALRQRFRSAATGQLGRNTASTDVIRMRRVPVRRTDPIPFFKAKLVGDLLPEKLYAGVVATAKKAGLRG